MLLKLRSRKKRVLTKCVKILDGHTISRRPTETEILLQLAREIVLSGVFSEISSFSETLTSDKRRSGSQENDEIRIWTSP